MHREGWRDRLFAADNSRSLPHARAGKILLRTAHLMATSMLVGGHAFAAPAGQLELALYAAIVSGAGLIFLETYPTLRFVFEGWGVMLWAKLALLCWVPFLQHYQVLILLLVVALASIGSHMPGRFRHYSLLYRKVIKE